MHFQCLSKLYFCVDTATKHELWHVQKQFSRDLVLQNRSKPAPSPPIDSLPQSINQIKTWLSGSVTTVCLTRIFPPLFSCDNSHHIWPQRTIVFLSLMITVTVINENKHFHQLKLSQLKLLKTMRTNKKNWKWNNSKISGINYNENWFIVIILYHLVHDF